ncbi:Iron/manganese superoxide dismutase [Monocercomonoides exilis]|uniref:Iron/manganese superoxide dismutase n=1 Tax=Monocercomonoides exilis TaxID=2049356 RepID=UPI0035595511|nr:Iron/manganese superoxide dismutase [Monocercomonoides exilis]|eukprot:MONOS_3256.1-p1 / transcript=MONOS_3256.1 / gene=MONOS_3256 / organism=Monocercomonoides_exilis_PA203 / gene_product=Iron/manganese superoxide dismutase / transcript_product=Iron/manganese superoxide dismutase / location=Mono_scaffold00075:73588-74220(-) / protein_length=211 / sequence_SO=supercontig / SO=protein_coding / is_pseudo=false
MSAPGPFKVNEELLAKLLASPMEGISANAINQHFDLYKGYVTNANALLGEIKSGAHTGAALIDRRRRLGFEVDGVYMHELFFENLTPANTTAPSAVQNFFVKYFGSFEKFVAEVENAGSTRGVGWVAVLYDHSADLCTVTWVEEHHLGMLVNVEPLLLIDCWEHAFVLDYKTTGRGPYVKAILKHIDWDVVAHRVEAAVAGRSVMRAVKH